MTKINQLEDGITLLLKTNSLNMMDEEVRKLCLIELINEKLIFNENEY